MPAISIKTTAIQAPERRDDQATTNLRIAIERASLGLASFLGFEPDLEQFRRDKDNRIIHYLVSGQPEDRSADGRPSIQIGSIKLPLRAREVHRLGLYARDIFGRWLAPVQPTYALEPWPVQMPCCGPIEQQFDEESVVAVSAVLRWDWSKRTPLEIRVGLKLFATDVDGGAVRPHDGVSVIR